MDHLINYHKVVHFPDQSGVKRVEVAHRCLPTYLPTWIGWLKVAVIVRFTYKVITDSSFKCSCILPLFVTLRLRFIATEQPPQFRYSCK